MKRLILALSDKGGVGKTFFIRFLADVHRLIGSSLTLADGDGSVGQLGRYQGVRDPDGKLLYPQPEDGVHLFDFHGSSADRDALLNLIEVARDVTIVDLPAASLRGVKALDAELGLLEEFRRRGFATTLVAPLTPFESSLQDVSQTLAFAISTFLDDSVKKHTTRADVVIVRNLHSGEFDDFTLFENSKTKSRIIAAQIPMLDFPRLKTGIVAAMERVPVTHFTQAYTSPTLSIADRKRAHQWVLASIAALKPHQKLFGFPADLDVGAAYEATLRQEQEVVA